LTGSEHARLLLWELHLQAKEYGLDPAVMLGVDPLVDQWLAWQIRRAVFTWGKWFESQQNEMMWGKAEDPPTKGYVRIPRYSPAELDAMLGIKPHTTDARFGAPDVDADREADELLSALRTGGADWLRWDKDK
jgi:hypothetical protein